MSQLRPSVSTKPRIIFPILSISWHGGTRVLIQVANYLAGIGYPVTFLVSRNRCRTPFTFKSGVTIRQVGCYTGIKAIDYVVFLCCVPFQAGANCVLIASFFVTYYPVRLLAMTRKLPYLYFVQDIESKYPPPYGAVLNRLCNWTYRDNNIVAANKYLSDRVQAEFGATSRSISVGPSDLFYDLPQGAAKKYDVVYMLRRESWKGLDRFLRFLAISNGRFSCLCVSQDVELGKTIADSSAVFCKPQTDHELIQCMDSARILLLTSYREGFALPPLEGMARGLPAVLFRCGGPDQYIVDGGNAIYVDSEEQAADAIEKLLGDPVVYNRMRNEAVVTADQYRMDKSLALMAEFVAQCTQ
jgi:glycosyltransferase involved in cell wall biosynthesis